MWNKIKPYIISIFIALAVGGASALLTIGNMDIYSEVKTPPISPPSFLFPIVWSILYILMGVSAAIVYKNGIECVQNKPLFQFSLEYYIFQF